MKMHRMVKKLLKNSPNLRQQHILKQKVALFVSQHGNLCAYGLGIHESTGKGFLKMIHLGENIGCDIDDIYC